MTPQRPLTQFVRALGLVFALSLAAGTAVAESHKVPMVAWDQEKASSIAGSLANHSGALYNVMYKLSDANVGSGYARAYIELKHKLRRMKVESRHLSAQLGEGKGELESHASYEDLVRLFSDARELARKIFVWKQLKVAADKVREDLNAIAPFYGGRHFEPLEL